MSKTKPISSGSKSPKMLDAAGAEEMVRANIGWMIVVANRILGDRSQAEDAVQEAFFAAFRELGNLEKHSSLKAWLHRITVNSALMKARQLKRLAEVSIDDYLPEFDHNGCRIEKPWNYIPSTEEISENEQARAQVQRAINILPNAYRTVLLLRDIEGYDTGEVAELLDISASNVKVRLHRARAAVKKILEPTFRGEVL